MSMDDARALIDALKTDHDATYADGPTADVKAHQQAHDISNDAVKGLLAGIDADIASKVYVDSVADGFVDGDGVTRLRAGSSQPGDLAEGDLFLLVPGFAWSDIAGLQFGFDANDIDEADATALATWADVSGYGRDATQGTAASQPLYRAAGLNGGPAVEFDGSDDLMKTAALGTALSQPLTIFIVGKLDTVATSSFVDGLDTTHRHQQVFVGTGTWRSHAGATLNSGVSANDSPHFWTVKMDGASSSMRVDGVAAGTGDVGANLFNGVTLGGRSDGSQRLAGKIGLYLCYARDLSADEVATVEARIASLWGL